MYILGVDIGTGSTKAIALEHTGKVLISAQVPYPTINSTPGTSEQDPDLIWKAFRTCIARITSSLSEPPQALGLSSAMHSLICVDDRGKALANMITWADNRSAEKASQLKNSEKGKKLYAETGTPIHAMSPLCKLLWLKESNEDLFKRTSRFISIKEFCWFKMFGTFEVDFSIASATGLFNIMDCTWHAEALELASLRADQLSTPVMTDFYRSGMADELCSEMKLPDDLKVVIGGSDGCLANVGTFATSPGIAALTIGTSGAIRVAGTSPVINTSNMPFNYRLDEKTFISGGPINNGGVALKWYSECLLKRPLARREDYDSLLSTLSTTPAGSDGLIFLPYILGERAPVWNSDTCGVFFGITAQHKQEHFTKAVVEGIVFSLYQIGRTLEENGLQIHELRVSGGFVRSESWVQVLANIFGKRVCLLNTADASAIGAALIAMKTLGIVENFEKELNNEEIILEPDMKEHQLYRDRFFPLYENLYKTLVLDMKIFHENRGEAQETSLEHTNL